MKTPKTYTRNLYYPIFNEIGVQQPFVVRIADWHNDFDVLLGTGELDTLGAVIDYETHVFTIRKLNISIPFQVIYRFNNRLQIPVTINNGEVILPEINYENEIIVPTSIHRSKNGFVEIPHPNTSPIEFPEPISVQPLSDFDEEPPPYTQNTPFNPDLIRTQHLSSLEKDKILQLCHQFKDIFYNENSDLTFTSSVKHEIRVKNEEPIFTRSFRHPKAMQAEISSQISKLLDNKIIRPSISPYSSPVWIVPKKMDASGKRKFRMVIDYRKLNENTVEDKYPLPRIDEILDNLGKCTYFTTLDLAQGFHQIEVHPNSVEKTAFTVPNGHFEYTRMPFGLKNAPATFQRMMDEVLREFLYQFCFVYMDDVIIFSKSLQDHLIHIKRIFKKFREVNLKIQLDKSEFLSREVAFLGHVITPEGIKPNPDKIAAIQNFPIPKTVKEIRSFLGLVGYYRRFIPNFSKITNPMNRCLRKGTKIETDHPQYIESFEKCKSALTNSPILQYPDFSEPFTLTTDASNIAIGAVLSQKGKPVAYYSRTLITAERNYSTIERELLAIIDSCKHFRPYLYGTKFTIETDHKPLVWLHHIKEHHPRLSRMKLKLEEFDFEIKYRKGKENAIADALSRIELNMIESDSVCANPPSQNDDFNIDEFVNETYENEIGQSTQHSSHENPIANIPFSEEPINHFQNQIILDYGTQYNKQYRLKFKTKHYYHITITKENWKDDIKKTLHDIISPNQRYHILINDPPVQEFISEYVRNTYNNTIRIYYCSKQLQDIEKPENQIQCVQNYHKQNHNGILETLNHFKLHYYWPNMRNTISDFINKCDICLRNKYERHPYKLPFKGPLLGQKPFDILHIDTFCCHRENFLTIIDSFSKYAQVYNITDKMNTTILSKLRHYFSHHNYPRKIVCDEGPEFSNNLFKEFCKLHKIELHFITVNNPNSNSPIERFHSTFTEKLRVMQDERPREHFHDLVTHCVLIYNQSIHSATGYSPFSILYGPYAEEIHFDNDLPIYEKYNQRHKDELRPFIDSLYSKIHNKETRILEKRNDNLQDTTPTPETGQPVYISKNTRNKLDSPYIPATVTSANDTQIKVLTSKNKPTNTHPRKIKRLRKPPLLQNPPPDIQQPGPSSASDP